MGEALHMLHLLIYHRQGEDGNWEILTWFVQGMQPQPGSHHVTLMAQDGPQKGHKNWWGRCWTWRKKVETSSSQWSEMYHIKNVFDVCAWIHSCTCTHRNLYSYITNKYNFTANFSSFTFVKSHRTTGKVKKNANVKIKLNFEAFLPSEFVVPWETLSNHKCQLQEPAWGVTFVLSFPVKINVIKKHTAPVQQILCGFVWDWSVHL